MATTDDVAVRWTMAGKLAVRIGSLAQLGRKRLRMLTPEDHAYIRGRYQETVEFADSLVGRIVSDLKANDRFDDSLIVVTSDHGEGLGAHGENTHSFFVYDTTMLVPLIFARNGVAAAPTSINSP